MKAAAITAFALAVILFGITFTTNIVAIGAVTMLGACALVALGGWAAHYAWEPGDDE